LVILNTSATKFAQWLEQHTEEMYLCVPSSRRWWCGFPPVRAPKEINETVILGITAPHALTSDMVDASLLVTTMATLLMRELETGPPDAAIWFKIIPLAVERVEVRIGCKARGAMDYFNKLLAAIAKRWPEAAEQLSIESPLASHKLPRKHAGTVTWLHLSDLHCKGKDDYDSATVLENLWEDIGERCQRISQDLKDLDFACLTGDLAYHGTKEEYQVIGEEVLPKLLAATGLDKTRLFVVPGNHDIWQKKVTEAAIGAKEKLLIDSKGRSTPITNALTKAEEREVYFPRLEAYHDFFQHTLGHIELDEEGYFYVHLIAPPSGITIAILGLNSAWLSYGGESDRGKLVLGEYQVNKAIRKAGEAHPDLLIALNHHPFEWLADNFDRQQVELLLRQCHFVLQGHRHRNKAYREDTLLYILAGTSYEDRYSPTLNSYNFVKLNLDKGEGRIHFRRYSHQKREWVSDNDVPGTDEGIKSFTLDR